MDMVVGPPRFEQGSMRPERTSIGQANLRAHVALLSRRPPFNNLAHGDGLSSERGPNLVEVGNPNLRIAHRSLNGRREGGA